MELLCGFLPFHHQRYSGGFYLVLPEYQWHTEMVDGMIGIGIGIYILLELWS